jgi:hypothetical protein
MYALLRAFEAAQADEQRDAIEELLPHVVNLAMHQTGNKVSCGVEVLCMPCHAY